MLDKWEVTVPALTGDEPRSAYIYVPDSISENPDLRYPVLYMFDGHNVFLDEDATYGKSWGMLEYLEQTEAQVIVAAPACNQSPDNSRLVEYCPFTARMEDEGVIRGRGKATMDWFVHEFKPRVDESCPTIPDRSHTFIAGSSMGGLMSLYALLRYSRYFSRAAALSPSIWFGQDKLDRIISGARPRKGTILYMDYGEKELQNHEGMLERYIQVQDMLMQKKISVTSRIVPGGDHSEASWERQLPVFMNVLLYGID